MKKEVKNLKNYINGEWSSSSKYDLNVINPFTEKVIARVVDSNNGDVNLAVKAAKQAFEL